MTRRKRYLFALLAASLPVLVLAALEFGLRAAGVGAAQRAVWTEAGHPDHLVVNPAYTRTYFGAFEPKVAFTPFRKVKPARTFRVFALGGSTTLGFPYHFYYGFPTRLQARLQAHALDHTIEVVNLGMTAVNSYTLWDLKDAVAAAEPDAVVLYAGHNEYYGPFGPGSTMNAAFGGSVGVNRFLLRARRWALVQALSGLLPADAPDADPRATMAKVVREAEIAHDGPVYRAGVAQFEANLHDVLETFRAADVPVYVGTLVSNLAGQPPLGETPEAAEAFAAGQAARARGDAEAARDAFLRAKELDGLRFRAPEAFNDVLRRLADEGLATLVDLRPVAGVAGAAFFDDHLHPNWRGYDAVAEAFFDAMKALPGLQGAGLSTDVARGYGLDSFEQAFAALQIGLLKADYPFDKDATAADVEAKRRRMFERLAGSGRPGAREAVRVVAGATTAPEAVAATLDAARSRRDTLDALRLYGALLHWQPFNDDLTQEAVTFAAASAAYDARTEALLVQALGRSDGLHLLNALAGIRIRQRAFDEAGAILRLIEQRDPQYKMMLYNMAVLHAAQGDRATAQQYLQTYRRVAQP